MTLEVPSLVGWLLLTAITSLPVWIAASLLDAKRNSMLRSGLVVVVGGVLGFVGTQLSNDGFYSLALGIGGFAIAAMFILGLGLFRAVGLTLLAAALSVAIGMGIASFFGNVFFSPSANEQVESQAK